MVDPDAHEHARLESAGVSTPRTIASALTLVAVLVVLGALLSGFQAVSSSNGLLAGAAAIVTGLAAALLLLSVAAVLRWLAAFWIRSDR
jgi:hypothetical protein